MTTFASSFERALDFLNRRRIHTALLHLDAAERAGFDADACAGARWECLMLLGRFTEAWRQSERIAAGGKRDPRALWNGKPFTGNRVIVRCLHGYGDAIQFVRYAKLLRQTASRIIVQTHPELLSLMQGSPAIDQAISWDQENPAAWDQQIEVMELPRAFQTTLETIPSDVPYLRIPEGIRTRVPERSSKLRIGLQWASGPWNSARSMSLASLDPLLHFAECEYFSFQRGDARQELRGYRQIHDVSGKSPHILEAAADLLNIDLLITVDTMLAHLAGALARPVWVLLPCQADWRWMLRRCDSPWYPTMRLFRQRSEGDWAAPINQAAQRLIGAAVSPNRLGESPATSRLNDVSGPLP